MKPINENILEANCIITESVCDNTAILIEKILTQIRNCQDDKEKRRQCLLANHVFKNLLTLKNYLTAFTQYGDPVELIFIDGNGHKHSLLNEKELSEEQLINLILDNHKTK